MFGHGKQRCEFMFFSKDMNHYGLPNQSQCEGTKSKFCVDGLCPVHCHQLHGTNCNEFNYVKDR